MERQWEFVSHRPGVQHAYEEMREAGQSHLFAEMCAFQQPPGCSTDTTFQIGKPDTFGFNMDSIADKRIYNTYKAIAKKNGISTNGKHYQPGLAQHRGDPRAWVESKDDVKKIAKSQGLATRGGGVDVDYRGGKVDADDAKPTIDPNLVKFWTEQKILKSHDDQSQREGRVTVSKTEYKHTYEDTHTSLGEGY
jgi:hypothetical protein